MNGPVRARIKICCIMSEEESEMAVSAGADNIGLVSSMPSGPGVITEDLIQKITRKIQPGIGTFLLTSAQDTETIVRQARNCCVNTVQIVDALTQGSYSDIRFKLPYLKIVQVIHVTGEDSINEAVRTAEAGADSILLDSGNPCLKVKELGGTGRLHDWSLSHRIVESVKIPVFLAGGLNADNAVRAIETVRPYGLDICSGVRTEGKLDAWKLKHFMDAVYSTI